MILYRQKEERTTPNQLTNKGEKTMKNYKDYTNEALNEELDRLNNRIWSLEMADRLWGSEKAEYEALRRERNNIYAEINARG